MENKDEDILNTTWLPEEFTGEVEVFNTRNNEIERMISDGEDSDMKPPPKQNAKKSKTNVKIAKSAYTNTNIFKFWLG